MKLRLSIRTMLIAGYLLSAPGTRAAQIHVRDTMLRGVIGQGSHKRATGSL